MHAELMRHRWRQAIDAALLEPVEVIDGEQHYRLSAAGRRWVSAGAAGRLGNDRL